MVKKRRSSSTGRFSSQKRKKRSRKKRSMSTSLAINEANYMMERESSGCVPSVLQFSRDQYHDDEEDAVCMKHCG